MCQTPQITYIIVTWNNEKEIFNCLDSIKNNTNCDFDIFVVDNASRDGTIAICNKFDFVTLIKSDKNLGFAEANNIALSKVKTKYVCFLNPDVILFEDIVKPQIFVLENEHDVGLTSCRLLNSDFSFQKSYSNYTTPLNIFLEILHFGQIVPNFLRKKYFQSYYKCCEQFNPDWVIGAEMMMRTTEAKQLGGFSEGYFMYTEDMDLCMKVHKMLGKSVRYIPGVSLVHLGGASEVQNISYKKQNKIFENLKKFSKKFYGNNGNALLMSAMSAALIRGLLLKLFYFKNDRQEQISKTYKLWLSAKYSLF